MTSFEGRLKGPLVPLIHRSQNVRGHIKHLAVACDSRTLLGFNEEALGCSSSSCHSCTLLLWALLRARDKLARAVLYRERLHSSNHLR